MPKKLFTVPTGDDEETKKFLSEYEHLPDHAVALILSAYLEHEIERTIIALRMPGLSAGLQKELFEGPNAPLGSFSAKTAVAQALGLLGPAAATDINLIRKVRNGFAHSGFQLSFDEPEIRDLTGALRAVDRFHGPVKEALRTTYNDRVSKMTYCFSALFLRNALIESVTRKDHEHPPAQWSFQDMLDLPRTLPRDPPRIARKEDAYTTR